MKISCCHNHILSLAFLSLTLVSGSPAVRAEAVTLEWEGAITGFTLFGTSALPAGVAQGAPIHGSVSYQSDQSIGSSYILGTNLFGIQYRFRDALIQTLYIGNQEWSVQGGNVELDGFNSVYNFIPHQSFGVDSTSASNIVSFPGSVGNPSVGFAVSDYDMPLNLFQDYNLATAALDFSQVTSGAGSLSTRLWDQPYGNIIDGYYIDFSISRISPASVPEPISPLLLLFGAIFLVGCRSRRANEQVA